MTSLLRLLARWYAPGWLLLASCSAAQRAPECNGMRREELTAILVSEVTMCQDQACIERAETRHAARRQRWVECGGDQ